MAGILSSLTGDTSLSNNLELLQQLALRNSLAKGDDSYKEFYQFITSLRIGNELYQRVSGQRKIDEFKAQCVLNISEFVKNNPKASDKALQKEVQEQVLIFAMKVKAM